MTGKMKALQLEIADRDEGLSQFAARIMHEAAPDIEFLSVVVYKTADQEWYVLVVDGVPATPWLSRDGLARLLKMNLVPAIGVEEQAARFQAGLIWDGWEDL